MIELSCLKIIEDQYIVPSSFTSSSFSSTKRWLLPIVVQKAAASWLSTGHRHSGNSSSSRRANRGSTVLSIGCRQVIRGREMELRGVTDGSQIKTW